MTNPQVSVKMAKNSKTHKAQSFQKSHTRKLARLIPWS